MNSLIIFRVVGQEGEFISQGNTYRASKDSPASQRKRWDQIKACCLSDLAGGSNNAGQICKSSSCVTFWTLRADSGIPEHIWNVQIIFAILCSFATLGIDLFSCLCQLKSMFTWDQETVEWESEETSNEIKITDILSFSYSTFENCIWKSLNVHNHPYLLHKWIADTLLILKGLIKAINTISY